MNRIAPVHAGPLPVPLIFMDPTTMALIGGLSTQVLAVVALALRLSHQTRRTRRRQEIRVRITRDGDV
ncbi:hypothetical protein GCM10011609_01220 [Lentzea pudingi]|uniref:Uncharacterized protein n=1 Tax=Lentzea pudingi TaxID=1789439 RepID=A0ABQ2H9R5_9PSEU|nr:hypothetical protein GCM10011609_01220 [Lentzea pudingi]